MGDGLGHSRSRPCVLDQGPWSLKGSMHRDLKRGRALRNGRFREFSTAQDQRVTAGGLRPATWVSRARPKNSLSAKGLDALRRARADGAGRFARLGGSLEGSGRSGPIADLRPVRGPGAAGTDMRDRPGEAQCESGGSSESRDSGSHRLVARPRLLFADAKRVAGTNQNSLNLGPRHGLGLPPV